MFLKNFLKIAACIVCFLLVPFFAFSSKRFSPLPVQKCEESNKDFTAHVAKKAGEFNVLEASEEQTEGGFCYECSKTEQKNLGEQASQTNRLANYKSYKSALPFECFLASSLRGINIFSQEQMTYCEDKNFENSYYTGRKKHCINEDYVDMISKAFLDMSYCFDLSQQEQVDFFHLINHESGFIVNAKSNTGARCLGQVTLDYVDEINNKIDGQRGGLDYTSFYKKALDRCPGLEKALLSNFDYFSCKVTHAPHICLFYTFFDFLSNYKIIVKNLEEPLDYMGRRSFSRSMKKHFHLPLKLNEVLIVRGTVRGKEVDWVFWDDSELFDLIQKYGWTDQEMKNLKAVKQDLFQNSDKAAKVMNYFAYNGGGTVARNTSRIMVRRLKQGISRSCPENSKRDTCLFRKKLQNGNSLSIKETLPYFESHLKKNYPSKSSTRRKEVADYVKKTFNDSDFLLHNSGADSEKYPAEFLYNRTDLEATKDQKKRFLDHFRKTCPQISLD